MSIVIKENAFLKEQLGGRFTAVPFGDLNMSMCVCTLKFFDGTIINFREIWDNLKHTELTTENVRIGKDGEKLGPYGSIIGLKFGPETKGIYPSRKKGFKNSVSVRMSLEIKNVNIKIFTNSLQIAGLQEFIGYSGPSDVAKCLIERLYELDTIAHIKPVYNIYPIIIAINFCLTNYHFKIGRALNLTEFDSFIHTTRKDMISIYDRNINNVVLRLTIPDLNLLFTVNHTGSIKLGIAKDDIEIIYKKLSTGYNMFYKLLDDFYG